MTLLDSDGQEIAKRTFTDRRSWLIIYYCMVLSLVCKDVFCLHSLHLPCVYVYILFIIMCLYRVFYVWDDIFVFARHVVISSRSLKGAVL